MFNYNITDFEILKFFSYTSTIQYDDVIAELDPNWVNYYPNLKKKFDEFYMKLAEIALHTYEDIKGEKKYTFMFQDNKTVFQVRNKKTGKVFFIGRYDSRRAIGKGCTVRSGYIYDFVHKTKSDYVENIYVNQHRMWTEQKFECNQKM